MDSKWSLKFGRIAHHEHREKEIADLLQRADAVVINLGTVNETFLALCLHVCKLANELKKPIILDPAGAGASRYRTHAGLALMQDYNIAIIRGNASEIMALSGVDSASYGVDSTKTSHEAMQSAQALSQQYGAAIVVSGKSDVVIDHARMSQHQRGSAFMSLVTGMGCLLSAVLAAFHAAQPDRYQAANVATLFYSLCGEMAEKKSPAPGSFRMQFLDALYTIPSRGQYEKQ